MKNDCEFELRHILLRNFDNGRYLWSVANKEVGELIDQQIASTIQQCVSVLEGMNEIRRYRDDYAHDIYSETLYEAITKIKELGEGK